MKIRFKTLRTLEEVLAYIGSASDYDTEAEYNEYRTQLLEDFHRDGYIKVVV